MKKRVLRFVLSLLTVLVFLSAYLLLRDLRSVPAPAQQGETREFAVPEYEGQPYCILDCNVPSFCAEEWSDKGYELYSMPDELGRCGSAIACLGPELMPDTGRESISSVIPSGWINAEYDFVEGGWLYNRCHLIAFQLSGENANAHNLITGTRYMNVEGMLPFENAVADYIRQSGNHVMYRVRPVFLEDELLARGIIMQALSVEDEGSGICFNVFVFNVQPGVVIDYSDGSSHALPRS